MMLFPIPALEPMRWTGDVKAFAFYVTSELLPRERLATVYVARKRFEDGSTVTLVRNLPSDLLPRMQSSTTAEGRIERDSLGNALRMETEIVSRPHGGSSFYQGTGLDGGFERSSSIQAPQPYPITILHAALEFDPRTGLLKGSWKVPGLHRQLAFTQPRAYWIDPLEAIAFGTPADLAAGWLFPTGFVAPQREDRAIGTRIVAVPHQPFALDLGGQREMFRRIDLRQTQPDLPNVPPSPIPGALLYRLDGRLAAYVPGPLTAETPGTVSLSGTYGKVTREVLPPVELKGKAKELWEKGGRGMTMNPDQTGRRHLFIPTSVTADERRALMTAIGERERPEPQAIPDEPPVG